MVDLSQLEKVKTPADIEADHQSVVAKGYLASTDWYVIRLAETGEEIPEDVRQKRADARKAVLADR